MAHGRRGLNVYGRRVLAERFIKTLIHEWAYCRLFRSNAARLRTLPAWLTTYSHD